MNTSDLVAIRNVSLSYYTVQVLKVLSLKTSSVTIQSFNHAFVPGATLLVMKWFRSYAPLRCLDIATKQNG